MSNAEWSFLEAAKVFLTTLRGDLGSFQKTRENLLNNPDITEHTTAGIKYLASGNKNGIPVIFFHGSPGTALDWKNFLTEKQNDFYIVALDRPDFKLGLAPFIELLKKFNKAILVGHSMGGGIIAALAAQHPEKVRGLVLMGASMDPALEKVFALQKLFTVPPLSWLLTRSIYASNKELLQYPAFLKTIDSKRVTCPVTVVHSHDDALVSFENTGFIRENFINAEKLNIISLDSGGHFLNETRPGEIWKAIKL